MSTLEGRTAIVTGAGRGLGRSYALLLAREGARVVVNDVGSSADGSGVDASPAQSVVDEIVSAGGVAVANYDDISTHDGAQRLVQQALDHFGDLHVLVNNAGILRDNFFHRMTEGDWDSVVAVHLKGHFGVLRHAVAHWHAESKAGRQVAASVINTTSASGTYVVLPGQTNYGAAKSAIASMSIIAASELGRIGVRVNAIAPGARTRMTEATPGAIGERMRAVVEEGALDEYSPDNVSPLVAHLAAEDCTVTGRVLAVRGGEIREVLPWSLAEDRGLTSDSNWDVATVAARLDEALTVEAPAVDALANGSTLSSATREKTP
ncbi:MAG: SDR family oxidoreductase [Actinomycetota bacterium]|nr:SDR family oxidoreductase [Actinomycetota bacterium]